MKTSKTITIALMAGIFCSFFLLINAQEKPIDPIQQFKDKKCNSCHSIDVIGIPKTNEKSKAPDLSNSGDRGPEFLIKYMMKEADIEGKKHGILFKGNEDELKALIGWLISIKPPKSE